MSAPEKPSFTPFVDVSPKLPDVKGGMADAAKEAFTTFGTTRGSSRRRAGQAAVAFVGSVAKQSAEYVESGKAAEVFKGAQQNSQAERERRGKGL